MPVAAMNQPASDSRTILLVEDEKALLEITQLNLESMGFRVIPAATADAALVVLRDPAVVIDLLVTDVVMPEMNGRTLYEKAQEFRENLPCLYISGYPADIIGRRGIIPEKVNFLAKPFTRIQLRDKLESILDGQSA